MLKGMSKGQVARLVAKQKMQERAAEFNSKSEDERLEEKLKELSKAFKISNSAGGDIA